MTIHVFLAIDQEILRTGLRMILADHPRIKLVGEAADGASALRMLKQCDPNVAVLHVRLPEVNGLEVVRQLKAQSVRTHFILMADFMDRHLADQALRAGAGGFLLADSSAAEALLAVESVAAGGVYLSPRVASVVLAEYGQDTRASRSGSSTALTSRERQVLQLVAEGNSTQEIAKRLKVSVRTVDAHRRQLTKRLGLKGVAELTKYAIREGLASL